MLVHLQINLKEKRREVAELEAKLKEGQTEGHADGDCR